MIHKAARLAVSASTEAAGIIACMVNHRVPQRMAVIVGKTKLFLQLKYTGSVDETGSNRSTPIRMKITIVGAAGGEVTGLACSVQTLPPH